ncbi:MAG: hypothetical protein AAF721_16525 [Myxococcota bacterium]
MNYRFLTAAACLAVFSGCPGDSGGVADTILEAGSSSSGSSGSQITASTIDPSDSLSATQGADSSSGADTSSTGGSSGVDPSTDGTTSTGSEATDSGSTAGVMDASGSTAGESSSDTVAGTTTDGSTSDGGTSTSTTSGSSTGSSSSSTDGSSSTGDCGDPMGVGNYDPCLDAMDAPDAGMCGFAGATCINEGVVPSAFGVCSQGTCVDSCDCPPSPPTGDADVVCGEIAGDDMIDECFLDCASGQTCPDNMGCFGGLICVHAGSAAPDDWGQCEDSGSCPLGNTCIIVDDGMGGPITNGVCSGQGCLDEMDCPAAPMTGTAPVACMDVTGMVEDCILDCSIGGTTCPDGMSCFAGTLCMWPIP